MSSLHTQRLAVLKPESLPLYNLAAMLDDPSPRSFFLSDSRWHFTPTAIKLSLLTRWSAPECTEGGICLLLKRSAPVLTGSKVSVCVGPFPLNGGKFHWLSVRGSRWAADTLISLAVGGGSGVVGAQTVKAPKYIVSSLRPWHLAAAFMTVCHDVAIFRCVSGCSACLDSRYPNFHGIFLAELRRT